MKKKERNIIKTLTEKGIEFIIVKSISGFNLRNVLTRYSYDAVFIDNKNHNLGLKNYEFETEWINGVKLICIDLNEDEKDFFMQRRGTEFFELENNQFGAVFSKNYVNFKHIFDAKKDANRAYRTVITKNSLKNITMRTQKLIHIDKDGNETVAIYFHDLQKIKLFYNSKHIDTIGNATIEDFILKFTNSIKR